MRPSSCLAAVAVCVLLSPVGSARQPAAESPLPPPDRTPQLVINHAGPHALVQSLAFGPDGTLYAGGYGKLVHRYTLRDGKYVAGEPVRVPVGPGNAGAVNAVAVSPDGKWVAVAGRAPVRGEVWAGVDDGVKAPTQFLPPLLKRDLGVVYLFNPADPQKGKVIRGPEGSVRAVAFAAGAPADAPVLVTAGVEWDAAGKYFGAVRMYDVTTGKEWAARQDLPPTATRPGLAAWATGAKREAVRVAVAWPPADGGAGKLLVWDVPANRTEELPDGKANVPLALRLNKDGTAAAVISGGFAATGGRLVVRPADTLGDGTPLPLTGDAKQFFFPLAVAPVGDATAVLLQRAPAPDGTVGRPVELRLIGADGATQARVPLAGVSNDGTLPMLAVSPDGKRIAVGGFADDRLEVYDAAALATGKAAVQTLAGAPGGFARVAFLTGDKLWLGGAADTAPRGGLVFDFAARKATTGPDAGRTLDAPPGDPLTPKFDAKERAVAVTIAGRERRFTLDAGERPTAAAYLPAGPPWDKALGAVVAVAHYHDAAAVTLVTLFDAATGRPLYQLNGPTLPITALAFSGSKPLLAAVGADRVVSVWSLKSLGTPFAAVEGVTLVERDGVLAVAGVEPTSPARAVLKPGDVIEAVGGEAGDLKPVATYRAFLLAVRGLPVGGTARVRVTGKAAAAVPVGRGVGHRHPLLDLWVNPVATPAGDHDWVGWTPAGPYDASSPAAEARLGWLSTTGNPAEPVRYAGAGQYRRLYYKTNFLRFLLAAADFGEGFGAYAAAYPRTPPALTLTAPEQDEYAGRTILRAAPAGLTVRLDDPADTLLRDRAVLRWRTVGVDGKPGAWRDLPFTSGQADLALPGYTWSRGPHRFEAVVFEAPDLPPAASAAATFHFVPPAPIVTLVVDGEKLIPGQQLAPKAGEVRVAAEVEAAAGHEVEVTLTTSAPGDVPVTLPRAKPGEYGPVTVKLRPDVRTTLRVTAATAGAGEYARYETFARDVAVRYTPPKPKPAPVVRLAVASPTDPPAGPGQPHVSDTAAVRLTAEVTSIDDLKSVEWDDGDGQWVAVALPPGDPKKVTLTRTVTLPAGKPRPVAVRATTAAGVSATDAVPVVWAAVPAAELVELPAVVRDPDLAARVAVRPAAPDGPAFTVKLAVDANGTSPREVAASRATTGDGWAAALHLAPGANRVGLVVGTAWKTVRLPVQEVWYVRPPLVLGVAPVAARGAGVGDVAAVVLTPGTLPPDRLLVNGRPVPLRRPAKPVGVFGVALWRLTAESVPLAAGGALPKSLRVVVRNADGDSAATEAAVIPPPPAPPPPPPPRVGVLAGPDRAALADGGSVRTDRPTLAVGVTVASVAKLTRVEVRRPDAAPGQPDRVPGIAADAAVPTPGGIALTAKAEVALRPGVNAFEVTAATATGTTTLTFTVSYTPPPVRVVIDAVEESAAQGWTPLPLADGTAAAAREFVRVRGRVVWADTAEAARAAGLEVVLTANEARHLPVELATPAAGANETAFVAPLFLHASTTQARVEVQRRGGQAVAQTGARVADAGLTLTCKEPLKKQRLHVLVIGPQVPEGGRAALARQVIEAVGGAVPADRPGFDRGSFPHKAFVQATLYRPLVYNVGRANIVGLLQDVEAEIKRESTSGKGTPFQNDLVVVYYQGRDLLGKDNQRRLHTTRSLQYAAAAAEPHAVRMDELPATPGVRLPLLNVASPDGKGLTEDTVAAGPPLLRYVWSGSDRVDRLLPLFRQAVARKSTLGEVVDWVRDAVKRDSAWVDPLTDALSPAVRARALSAAAP